MSRQMILAGSGWYPSDSKSCKTEIASYIDNTIELNIDNPQSVIVPHAGWFFCGKLMVNTIRLLKENNKKPIDTVFIFGGHLPKNYPAILETFDYAKTPLGKLTNNQQIIDFIINKHSVDTEEYIQDNTIEVLMPIVNYFFGDIKIIAIYLPPNMSISGLLNELHTNYGDTSLFIGSTDLTHYGPNYGFYHSDNSIDAVDWVKKHNDKDYIDLLLDLSADKSLEYADKNKAACSAGAALGALWMAKKSGKTKGRLVGYYTSYDIHKSSSFVGYAGIIY